PWADLQISFSNDAAEKERKKRNTAQGGRSLRRKRRRQAESIKMVKVLTYFGMTLAAFAFWQSMDKVHVWIALHQDEKQERMEKEAEVKRVRAELLRKAREEDPLA
uniref:Uncharacterized protein n=1 Tax=Brassica oleracea var. oleracea TaxID=109376 RepID=A0A0D3CYS2_BRAOL